MVASSPMSVPLLWHFPISHFNEKVRWTLDWKGVPHVRRAMGPSYLPRALLATGQPRLPILFLDGHAIADSTRIIAALEERYPERPLYPADPEARRRALELEDWFDEEVGHAIRTALVGPAFNRDPVAAARVIMTGLPAPGASLIRAVAPIFRAYYRARHHIDDAAIAASRGKIDAALDRIERELGPSGYLVEERFTVADLTAAALLGVLVVPPEMQYRPPGVLPPEFVFYRDTYGDRPALRWAREMYRRHRGTSREVAA